MMKQVRFSQLFEPGKDTLVVYSFMYGPQMEKPAGTTYNRDYHGEAEDGRQIPALNVFVRRGDKIHHFYNSGLLYAPSPEGQEPRHVDPIWPLWNPFDFTPDGRGKDFHPKLAYGKEPA
jgi:predicted dithiol-disulfide oxidoreductase (DUF899 family)